MDSWIEIKTGWRKQKKGNSSGCLHIHIRCFWISLVCSQYFVVILIFPFLHRNQRHASHLNLLAWVLSIHWNPYRVLCRWTRLVTFDNVWKVGKLLTFISLFKQYCSSWAQSDKWYFCYHRAGLSRAPNAIKVWQWKLAAMDQEQFHQSQRLLLSGLLRGNSSNWYNSHIWVTCGNAVHSN